MLPLLNKGLILHNLFFAKKQHFTAELISLDRKEIKYIDGNHLQHTFTIGGQRNVKTIILIMNLNFMIQT